MTAPTTLDSAWPLFGVRIRSPNLVLRLPRDDDLAGFIDVAKAGIHEPDEMPFGVAWSIVPSPEFERSFVQHHWGARATWQPEAWELHLMIELDGRPIGGQSIGATRFGVFRTVHTGSWLGRAWQGRGLGKEMRAAVLAFAFDGLGAQAAESEAFLDNHASAGVSRSLGYDDNGLGSLAPEGVARPTQRYRMTLDGWRSRPRPEVLVEGLEGLLPLFGASG